MGSLIAFFASFFGFFLNLIYSIVGNYGWSIIIFGVLVKILMFPLSIKQQKTMIKNNKIQEKMKIIQFKYKNDPEKLNQEVSRLYKDENMRPFGGCSSMIIQLILLISVFYLVRTPLTYMKNINQETIDKYYNLMQENNLIDKESAYKEIEIIREIDNIKELKNKENLENVEENYENVEKEKEDVVEIKENVEDQDNQNNQENKNLEINDEELDKMKLNMNFLGLDLSKIPSNVINIQFKQIGIFKIPLIHTLKVNRDDLKVFIIPILYVVLSFISMKFTANMQNKKKEQKEVKENNEEKSLAENEPDPMEMMNQMNKNMSLIFPIMYISVALIAPLGLALYWLINSVLMIIERLIINKIVVENKEE